MRTLDTIPEIRALDSRESLIRIPFEQDIPVTPRIRCLVDSLPFRRLASISQLGLVSLVYPGAIHTRFEHSLGVYRNALLFLKRLSTNPGFCERISPRDAEVMIVAALLHDIGHWSFCHAIEDMDLDEVPDHERLARQRIADSAIPKILEQQFGFSCDDVADLLDGSESTPAGTLLRSLLSGPIDVDKMDYLYRDSLHAGVPYGMHYDRSRLIGSLCLDESGTSLAITEKGRTAAELMVFARYVMFSEVYWHHTVRSATAMLQRVWFQLRDLLDVESMLDSTDDGFRRLMKEMSAGTPSGPLVDGLFGGQRRLYKRLAQLTVLEHPGLFERMSRRGYAWLFRCSNHLAEFVARRTGVSIQPGDLLIDAPPPGLEVQFQISVQSPQGTWCQLEDVSPVVRTLAQDQFDNYVKRVRVFLNPRHRNIELSAEQMNQCLAMAIDETEKHDS